MGVYARDEIEAIYRRNFKLVYQICLVLMKNVPDAEDAAQTVFRRVMEWGESFRDPEHERAWLIVTARNECRDQLKHWWRRRRADASVLDTLIWEQPEDGPVWGQVATLPEKHRLAPTAEQEQAVLDHLLQTERKVAPMKKLKKLTVVGIAAALMLISCTAAVVTGLDQRLINFMDWGEQAREFLPPGALVVDIAAEDNGATFHVTQVLMDRHTLMILAEFVAPEGVVLDNKGTPFMDFDSFELKFLNEDGQPCSERALTSYGFTRRFLEDEDPLDNHMAVLFDIQMGQGMEDEGASYVRLSFTDLGWYDFDLCKFVSLYSGTWSCDIPLPQEDMGRTYEVGVPVGQTDGVNVILKKFYLSPMTPHITLEREIPVSIDRDDVAVRHRWQWVLDRENSVVLKDREGRVIPLQVGFGSAGFREQEESYRMAEITDLE